MADGLVVETVGRDDDGSGFVFMAPRYDVVFKMLFGDPEHTDVTVAFLKTVVDLPDEEFERIEIVDPSVRADDPGNKQPVVDVRLTTSSGKMINIEVQLDVTPEFKDRVVYGLSKTVAAQLRAGDAYLSLRRSIAVVITWDPLFRGRGPYHREFVLRDRVDGVVLSRLVEVHTLELGKVPVVDDRSPLWEWSRFLKIDSREELEMVIETASAPVRQVAARLKELSRSEANRMVFEARLRQERDQESRERFARMEGRAEGRAEGHAEGRAEGHAEGRAEGRLDTVGRALAGGLRLDEAVRLFGLSDDEVARLSTVEG
jgi:predicted transposase/invertase (TIGR01784 family)